MAKVGVRRDENGKIDTLLNVRGAQAQGVTEFMDDQDAECQAFLNPPVPGDKDDVFLDQMYTSPYIRAIVKKLSDIEGKSEFQVRNELKVLAKQIT
jgi:hypothetical protein